MEPYVCNHCGHRFEAEAAETLVCPQCFWSTSVKREEKQETLASPSPPKPLFEEPTFPRIGVGIGVIFAALFLVITFFLFSRLKKPAEKIQESQIEAPQEEPPSEGAIRDEDLEILDEPAPLERGPLSEAEKGILAKRVPLRSPNPPGIRTPPWGEAQFKEFLEAAQAQYKIPLSQSYRKKLEKLFREQYLAAAKAFEAGDFLKARNGWIRSLAFPVYGNDLKRHRGVVLTMLRPFINDTLAKIGEMNRALTAQDLYGVEGNVRASYQVLHDLLQSEAWEEGHSQISRILKQIEGIQRFPEAVPPPLPEEVTQVDLDIREVLFAQAAPLNPSLPDWEALREDLLAKEKIVKGRLDSREDSG